MGEIDGRLNPEENEKLSDAAPLGRSLTTMSSLELSEYAGAAWRAFNLLEIRVNTQDSLGTGFLAARLDADMLAKLEDASVAGRTSRKLNHTELTEVMGALYAGYEALSIRVNALDSAGGSAAPSRLETEEKLKLLEAAPAGRSLSQLGAIELTEAAGATDAAYTALEARVFAIDGGS